MLNTVKDKFIISPLHGKTWNELNKIMKRIHILEKFMDIPEDLQPFVWNLRALKRLINAVGGRKLNPNYAKLIEQFSSG